MIKEYAVIKIWDDNPDEMQVIDYFYTIQDCKDFISKQKKDSDNYKSQYKFDIAKYE